MSSAAVRLAVTTLLAAGVVGCHDVTKPVDPAHPIVGMYDVTTTLETRSFRAPCSPPSTQPYCTAVVDVSGIAALSGTVTIANTVVVVGDSIMLPAAEASLHAIGCDDTSSTACTPMDFGTVTYDGDPNRPTFVDGEGSSRVYGVGTIRTLFSAVELDGQFAGDSIVGTVTWVDTPNSHFDGTFVARRVE